MKLIGVIAVLVLLATSCQKDEVRPNNAAPTSVLRSSDTPPTIIGDDGNTGTAEGSGITDPNDANRTNKNPKPKQ